ncbi:MAG: hypothetical protein ABI182_01775 [Candidatus Baltobacteraceae bacterium]
MTIRLQLLAAAAAALLVLSACNGGSTATPTPSVANISGDYTGSVQDSVTGVLTASAILAQHGNSAGGTLSLTGGATTLITGVSFVISPANALNGTIVEDLPNGITCTMSATGTYNSTASQITGSYSAVTGCGGETGTFTLNQQCTDTVTSSSRRRPLGVTRC